MPTQVKKVLTTMQIIQFVIGASFAFAHLFIAYTIPVSVPYTFSLADLTSIASAVTADAASVVSVATATASAGVGSWMKKLAFRAAGREGLAENVVNEQGETFGIDALRAAEDLKAREEIRYRDDLQWIHCTDTSGQVFAILLNCMYLAPLTFLFVKFFIRAYSQRLERRRSSTAYNIEQSAKDAFHSVAKQAVDAIGDMHGSGEQDKISTEKAIDSTKNSTKEEAKSAKKSPSEREESGENSAEQGVESERKKEGGTEQKAESEQKKAKDQGVESEQKETKDTEHGAESEQKDAKDQGVESEQKETKDTEEGAESEQKETKDDTETAKSSSEHGTDEGKESTEPSSTSETAASTEPMSEGGNLADDKTELHESGLQ